jgi:hypothetical protein
MTFSELIDWYLNQLLLQPDDFQVSGVLGAFLQRRASCAEKLFPPLQEPGRGDARFP